MKYIGLLSSAASGKLGGVVASHNRGGQYFRQHKAPTQPRTAAQKLVRNQLQAFSAAFKSLTASQVAGWNALGLQVTLKSKLGTTYHPTGQQLFVSCNKHLANIGVTTQLSNPPSIPSIPGFTTFTATPTYAAGVVTAFGLAFTPTPSSAFGLQVRATSTMSAGRSFIGKSQYRNVYSTNPAAYVDAAMFTAYVARFGPLPGQGSIGFAARYVDPASGFAGTPVSVMMPFSQSAAGVSYTFASVDSGVFAHSTSTGIKTCTVTNLGRGSISLTWAVSGLPGGVTVAWTVNPQSIATPAVATFTLPALAVLGVGTYPIQISATFGTFVYQISNNLIVAS